MEELPARDLTNDADAAIDDKVVVHTASVWLSSHKKASNDNHDLEQQHDSLYRRYLPFRMNTIIW